MAMSITRLVAGKKIRFTGNTVIIPTTIISARRIMSPRMANRAIITNTNIIPGMTTRATTIIISTENTAKANIITIMTTAIPNATTLISTMASQINNPMAWSFPKASTMAKFFSRMHPAKDGRNM